MTDQKIKTAADKPPLNLVPQASLIGPARVAQHGASKYARGNWHTADDVTGIADRYAGGVLRHLGSMQNANGTYDMMSIGKLDGESGLPEIDHAIMGLLMLRGLAIKHEFMPTDPGVSLLLRDRAAPAVDAPARQLELNLAAPSDGRPTTEIDPEVLRDAARMAEADARLAEIAGTPRPSAPWVPKVGDRVVVLQCALGYLEGLTGVLIEMDDEDPRYQVRCFETDAWCVSVAPAGPGAKLARFTDLRTGARVLAIAPTGYKAEGTITSYREVSPAGAEYRVEFPGSGAGWYFAHNLTNPGES